MSRLAVALLLLAATGCAGRWMAVEQPIHPSPTRPLQDYRVVLRNDSVVVLRNAVLRNDSLVELPRDPNAPQAEPPPRGVDLMDAVRVEQWQPRGERITGGVVLGLLAGLLTVAYVLLRGLGGPGS